MHTFIHNGSRYTKIIPSKKLFNSSLIHEVVTRGDFFALNIATGQFTVLPGSTLLHDPVTYDLVETPASIEARSKRQQLAEQAKATLALLKEQLTLDLS
jgi:hypothetical protein